MQQTSISHCFKTQLSPVLIIHLKSSESTQFITEIIQSLITFPVPCLLTQQLAHGQLHQHLFIILLNNFWNTRYEVAQISDNAWPWSKLNMQSHQFFWRSFVLTFGPGSGQNCTLGIHSISKCFYFFYFWYKGFRIDFESSINMLNHDLHGYGRSHRMYHLQRLFTSLL